MGRIRTIKPEFFSSEEMASTSAHARLLAIGLLTLADCKGRLRWVPMQVHSQVLPWEANVKIEELLGELTRIGYVVHYEVDGKRYVEIVNFLKHQRLSGKESAYTSKLPPPPANAPNPTAKDDKFTGKHSAASPGSSRNPLGTGEQRNIGTGEQGNTLSSESDEVSETSPDEVFQVWNESKAITKVRLLTPERRRKLKTRLADPSWPWQEAIGMLPIPNSGKFTWQPCFDWLIENSTNALAIVEGKYNSHKGSNHDSRNSQLAVGTGSLAG